MSQIPSNSMQFAAGLESAQGNIALMGQNQRAKMEQDLALRQLAQRGQQMQQEERMQVRALGAEAANYRALNKSRADLQTQELAQNQRQFDAQQQFLREQAQAEKLMAIELQRLQAKREAANAKLISEADDSGNRPGLRAERRQLDAQMVKIKSMMAAAQHGLARSQGMKGDRMKEVGSRLTAYGEAVATRRQAAQDAAQRALTDAMLNDGLDGGFVNDIARRMQSEVVGGPGLAYQAAGIAAPIAGTKILMENLASSMFGYSDPEAMKKRMTDLQTSPAAMAGAIVHNAFSRHGDAFGLDSGKKAEAAVVATEMVGSAAILAGLNPEARNLNDESVGGVKAKIAQGFGKLRQMGMGDEQITALMLDGLEGVGEGGSELLLQFGMDQKEAGLQKVLLETTDGVGRLADILQAVADDSKLMQPVGGTIEDASKFDIAGITRKADSLYGLMEDPRTEELVQMLRGTGMADQQVQEMMALIGDTGDMTPQEYEAALRAMASEAEAGALRTGEIERELGLGTGQFMARGQGQIAEDEAAALEALAARFGG
jgi:hypothetical protein